MSWLEFLQIPVFQRALLASFIAGSTLALMGTVVIQFQLTTIRFALMHIALLGGAIGMLLGTEPIYGAMVAIIAGSLLFGPFSSWFRMEAAVTGAFFMTGSLAIALALFYVAKVPAMEVFSLFTGSVLTLTDMDLWLLAGSGAIILMVFLVAYREIQLIFFDPAFAAALGIPVTRLQHLLLFLTGISIGLALKLVGALLIDALVLLPAMAAGRIASGFRSLLFLTVLFGVLTCTGGFMASIVLDLPTGATITMTGVLLLAGTLFVRSK